ncbi:hypothetical protein IQ266_20495 [filamentous cyanobacterium LEGE 11480]|uniref:Outer membrane protein beta-barrel domain-containing protein n=1 Tax=Romeriopsis navalis LEGE 11480 TaxID=2777977 RepID=A0A928VT78_9CYAN|nr:hypothetical protein [Romeriopsis navalis]MBE9032122.1 hypothetical protein [Romeriopsis navalis LEGE 11480]
MRIRDVWQSAASTAVVTVVALAGVMLGQSEAAQAQAAYGSYIGIGPAFGLTEGNGPNEDREVSGLINARYKFLELPISVRAQAFIGDGVSLVPTVSYDIPLNWQTDAYIGVGAAVNLTGSTPVGSKTGFAIQPGIDYVLPNSNLVIFGNAVIAFDAYENDGGTAASIQGGVGLRF